MLAEGIRVGFILFLAILVSGLVPMLIQTYGWYDMALKAGGMDKIVEAVTEAPACEFCRAAQEMQQKSEPSHENTPGKDRVETVKVYAVHHGHDLFKARSFSSSDSRVWRSAGNEIVPDRLALAPSTPPPEFFV
ncbi:hypothetical protein [Oceaniferula spumae]